MKTFATLFIILLFGGLFIYAIPTFQISTPEKQGLQWFKKEAPIFIESIDQLEESLNQLRKNDSFSLEKVKKALTDCRLQYKKISYLLEYYFPYEAAICNGPPAPDPEEDEVMAPAGLQVIGAWLFEPNPTGHLAASVAQAEQMGQAIEKVLPLVDNLKTSDASFLQSIDLELVRIMTLYLSGFDSPNLKTGISESFQSFNALEVASLPFCKDEKQRDSAYYFFTKGKEYLREASDFDSFNRLYFLTHYALPVQKILHKLIQKANGTESVFTAINTKADNLFQSEGLSKSVFPNVEGEGNNSLVDLGRRLFSEKALSQNHQRSCASCHKPDSYFMDGLERNHTLNGSDTLPRNTPTLLYSGMQYMQFWDGRVSSLEEQINAVLKNNVEMGSSEEIIVRRLQKENEYVETFRKLWPTNPKISMTHVASALAAYVRSLTPFTSPFDSYIEGDSSSLSASAKRGFNLFMGKGGCGKCHFAPVFNGLMPPLYTTTEFEVTGTTANDNFSKPVLDTDSGRYNIVPVPAYKGAFKTPTVRNAAVTAPYMHNGAFPTLKTLIDFYDKGGGEGMGLEVPQQTLSPSPLNLSNKEKNDLIAFIESLTDKEIKK